MAEPVIGRRGGVVRCFAEFSLLPDLLHAHAENPGSIEDWRQLLDERPCNQEHVEDEFVPWGGTMTETMAEDADRFCRWVGLIGEAGDLSPAGGRIARIGEMPLEVRDKLATGVLTRVLAEQIQECYLGVDGLRVANLLSLACTELSWSGHEWPDGLQGLLLVEMETLVHWAFVDADRANGLVNHLPIVRDQVIHALRRDPEVRAGRETVDATVVAEVLAEVHWHREELALDSELTLTELRATALALIFAELLAQSLLTLPLQVLRPRRSPERGG